MLDRQLDFILKGGRTRRYHTNGTIPPQSVAEHSFMVAWLLGLLYGDDVIPLMAVALAHDLAEGQIGDVASPIKRKYPELKEILDKAENEAYQESGLPFYVLSDNNKRMLKMADNMEGLLYCAEEIRRGNVDAIEIYNNYYSYIMTSGQLTNKEMDMLLAIERRLKCQTQIEGK